MNEQSQNPNNPGQGPDNTVDAVDKFNARRAAAEAAGFRGKLLKIGAGALFGLVTINAIAAGCKEPPIRDHVQCTKFAEPYTVQPGDTLTAIDQMFDATLPQISGVNGLPPDGAIHTGQVLQIPERDSCNTQ